MTRNGDKNEPTCTEKGVRTYTCTSCGDSFTEDIPAHGHSYDEGVIIKQPSEAEAGEKLYTCRECGGTYTEILLPVG